MLSYLILAEGAGCIPAVHDSVIVLVETPSPAGEETTVCVCVVCVSVHVCVNITDTVGGRYPLQEDPADSCRQVGNLTIILHCS